jgi:hypothetical protein
MSRATYGHQVKERAKRLLEAILDFVNYDLEGRDHIDLEFRWDSSVLFIKTKLRSLEELTRHDRYEGQLTRTQIRESLLRMKDFLEILNDNRVHQRGSEIWEFSLTLWSRNKSENLNKFEQKWEESRPPKSKQANGEAPKPQAETFKENSLLKALVFPRCDHYQTTECLKRSLKTSRTFALYSIAFNFLWTEDYFQTLEQLVVSGELSQVRLCLANVSSPEILLRFSHEKNQTMGIGGLEYRIKEKFLALERKIKDPSRFEVRLFEHYPTYAMLIFDKEMYVYLYPFQKLGNSSPTFYWKGESEVSTFFHEQFANIWAASKSASQVYAETKQPNESTSVVQHENYTIKISVQKS